MMNYYICISKVFILPYVRLKIRFPFRMNQIQIKMMINIAITTYTYSVAMLRAMGAPKVPRIRVQKVYAQKTASNIDIQKAMKASR